jgi:hypothetical protein
MAKSRSGVMPKSRRAPVASPHPTPTPPEQPEPFLITSVDGAWGESSVINCETVRSYVSQVGLAQARALAQAGGMRASQEWSASQGLAKGD